ncbi:MAG: hypothetical protein HY270_10260 [Deltaproteobacteria bacterium]|nr:hypothetical protein [Deltaproteobacteria bacterium]
MRKYAAIKLTTLLASLVAGLACSLIPTPGWSTTLHVENWGVDSPTCGTSTAPCRSIGKASSLSMFGDTILVGPGRYSNDLDGDSVYDEPGEEPANGLTLSNVTVKSTHGAAATRIEYGGNFSASAVIYGIGITFGVRNHGFTVVFQQSVLNVLRVIYNPTYPVVGNILYVFSPSPGVDAITAAIVRDNRVTAGSPGAIYDGIQLAGFVDVVVAERNAVVGALFGLKGPSIAPNKIRHNVALENGYGFRMDGDVANFTSNIAIANSAATGVYLNPGSAVTGPFEGNTLVGNGGVGNCGLFNDSGSSVIAKKNFWGAATGPGADPGDLSCSGVGSSTDSTLFLTAPVAGGLGALQ